VAGGYLLRRAVRLPSEVARLAFLGLEREFIVSGLERLGVEQALEDLVTGIDDDAEAISALESSCYMRSQLLRDTDWASMAHSIEVRVPLVDREVVQAVARLRREGRPPAKRELADLPTCPLPMEIRNRPKTGFSVPVRHWLSQAGSSAPERGLRHWQQIVGQHFFMSAVAVAPHATG
jgi:asparagine synthase (glutamine-hydrolysing)